MTMIWKKLNWNLLVNHLKRVIKAVNLLHLTAQDIDSDIDPSENKINKDAAWFPMEDAENDSLEDSYGDGDDAVYEEKSSRNNIR